MIWTRYVTLIGLLSGLLVGLSSLASAATPLGFIPKGNTWSDWFLPGNPRVIETGIEIERWNGSEQFVVEWLDDRRIAFSEVIDPSIYEKYGSDSNSAPMPHDYLQIVFYDTVSGKKEIYKPGNLSCLKNGRIAYRIVRPSINMAGIKAWQSIVYGEIGKEHPYELQKNEFINQFDCEIQQKLPDDTTGVPIRYLKREHGYIDVGNAPEKRQRNARYVRADGKAIELPFIGSELHTIRWLGDYWYGYALNVYDDYIKTKDDPQALYLLKPNGEIYKFPRALNAEKSIGSTTTYFPGRSGAIGMEQQPIRMDMPGRSGAYLDDGYSYRRLQSGFVTGGGRSLSPDGCKLPFGNRRAFMDRRVPAYLMILDVCGEKK